jgi:cytochrome c556
LVAVVLVAATFAAAQSGPGQTIAARQEAMKGLGGAMKTLTGMVRGESAWSQAEAVNAASLINGASKVIPSVFPQGTGPEAGKTAALPSIWQMWADFQAKSKALDDESAKLLQFALTGNLDGLKGQFPNVGKACGGCHEVYREKK